MAVCWAIRRKFPGTVLVSTSPDISCRTITTNPATVYETTDNCATWNRIYSFPNQYLSNVAYFDSNTIYANYYNTLYKSTDGGDSWSSSTISYDHGYIYEIATHPTNSNIVYACGYKYNSPSYQFSFATSTNGGTDWTSVQPFSFDYFIPQGIAVSKSNPNYIYVAGYKSNGSSYYGAVLQSSNGGTNWTDISSRVDTGTYNYMFSVAVDPTDNNKVYVGGYYFYYSTNAGGSFNKVSTYLFAQALAIDPVSPNIIYAGGSDQVYKSTNSGLSWTTGSGPIEGYGTQIMIPPTANSNVYLSTANGLFASSDSGSNWATAHNGINNSVITAICPAPSNPSTLYAENDNIGVVYSTNSGNTWSNLGYFVACGNIGDLAVHPTDPDTVLALEGSG